MQQERLLTRINKLPMLPTVLVQLMSMDSSDELFFEHFEAICKNDPGLATKVLSLCNSAYYPGREEVSDLKEASIRLGTSQIIDLVATISVIKVFAPSTNNDKRIWLHAIEVANLAQEISKEALKLNEKWQHQIYTCGLLHDVGLLVQFNVAPEMLHHVDDYEWKTPLEHIESEQEVFSMHHTEIGGLMCQKWGLPKIIGTVAKYHHDYDLPQSVKDNKGAYHAIRIIQLADFISEFYFHSGEFENKNAFMELLKKYPLLLHWVETNVNYEDMTQAIGIALAKSKSAFGSLGLEVSS